MKIIIVGDGKVGLSLTQMLTAEGHNVTVVDSNPKVLERMQEECDALAVQGHGASRPVLEEAGANKADVLIAATSADEVNLLSCLIAKKMGCASTIARVRSPEYTADIELLREEMGLSFSINPEESCAREAFRLLQYPSFLAREPFTQGKVEIVRFKIDENSPLLNVALQNLYPAAKVRVLVCAVLRDGKIAIPHGNFVLQKDDDVYIAAPSVDLAALVKHLGLEKRKISHVVIVGGSLLAFYLSQLLIKSGVRVKIVESDPERCQTLSQLLPEADIVAADGTDKDIMLSEGFARCDALVSLTGIDEENIVLSMYARQLGIKTTVTKCNRTQYADMLRKNSIDTVISPKINCAEEIVRYVRAMENGVGGQMLTMHQIGGGQAEALEFRADETTRGLNITLRELRLKAGVLIACITRGGTSILPTGDAFIQSGDLVVVVAAADQHIGDLSDILEN